MTRALSRPAQLYRSAAWLFFAVALQLASISAWAQRVDHSTEHVDASLVSRSTHVMPGRILDLALRLLPDEGWHTYWKNPGDTGLPTRIQWELPAGFKAGEVQWPVPEWIDYEGLTNFGFHGETWLLVPVAVPFNLPMDATSEVRIGAKARWLVCREVCVPEQASFELVLPVAAYTDEEDIYAGEWAADFDRAWQRTPVLREDISGRYTIGEQLQVRIPGDYLPVIGQKPRAFIGDKGIASNLERPALAFEEDTLLVTAGADPYLDGAPEFTSVVIAWGEGDALQAIEVPVKFDATLAPVSGASKAVLVDGKAAAPGEVGKISAATLLNAVLFALLGGLILNAMPCVFPVLSLKVISLVESGNHSARERQLHGLAYTAGVVMSFLLIAALLIALRGAGEQIGWGFQLQSPWFVAVLVYLLFLLGLSMSGVVELGSSLQNFGSGFFSDNHPWRNSFLTGVLATVVATPCTAPFMGTAMGIALSQPALVALLIFAAMGLGLALPFLLIAFVPALASRLPRPGDWMTRLKELLAFPIYLTAVWLLWVFARQVGSDSASALLVGLVVIALAAWLWRNSVASFRPRLYQVFTLIAIVASVAMLWLGLQLAEPATASSTAQSFERGESNYEPYSRERLDAAVAAGKTVFTNMTADWCITCKVNERVALKSEAVEQAFANHEVVYLRGDWTNSDPAITEYLEGFQRNGVPLYVVYKKGVEARVLPQILTPETVVEAVLP